MIDPRLLMSQPQPVDPKKRQIAQMIMSGAPLNAPQPTRAAPVFGEPMQLDPAMQDMFDGLSPADQMLWEDEYQRGVSPEELYRMFDPSMQENMEPEGRFDDAAAFQVASDQPLAEDLKLTEGQSKDVNYFRRGLSAHQELSQPEMEQALLQWTDSIAGNFGVLGRKFQDAEYQQAKRAADEFLAMVLRKDTGAAVTAQEFELYGPIYLPMPGDKPEVIAAKRNAREQFLRGMEMGAGTAGPLIRQSREELRPSEMSDEDILRMLQGGN